MVGSATILGPGSCTEFATPEACMIINALMRCARPPSQCPRWHHRLDQNEGTTARRGGFNKTKFVASTQIYKKSLFRYFQTSEAPIFGKEIISSWDGRVWLQRLGIEDNPLSHELLW